MHIKSLVNSWGIKTKVKNAYNENKYCLQLFQDSFFKERKRETAAAITCLIALYWLACIGMGWLFFTLVFKHIFNFVENTSYFSVFDPSLGCTSG